MSIRAIAVLALTALSVPALAADAISPAIAAAVADPARPQADRDRDADRKPAEVIAFAGIKPGDTIAEISPGGGYFTRIFSKVVGDKGTVYGLVPGPRPGAPAPAAGAPPSPMEALAASYKNVKLQPMGGPASYPPVDFAWTSLNYHDIHNRPNADLLAFNKGVYDSLKPGGIYIVIDHAAADGSGTRDTSTFHRIDPALVKSEVTAAGFQFVGESNALRNPADTRDKGVRDVPRGKTDQFVYKFRKPT